MTWAIRRRISSPRMADRTAGCGCRLSPTCCKGRCSASQAIPDRASARPGRRRSAPGLPATGRASVISSAVPDGWSLTSRTPGSIAMAIGVTAISMNALRGGPTPARWSRQESPRHSVGFLMLADKFAKRHQSTSLPLLHCKLPDATTLDEGFHGAKNFPIAMGSFGGSPLITTFPAVCRARQNKVDRPV